MRSNGRGDRELRQIVLEAGFSKHAEGSCLARFGDTHVLCTASLEDRVPPHVYGTGAGWVTAEYGMLPRSTHERMAARRPRGKQGGRTLEIQRLIGRALRASIDLKALGRAHHHPRLRRASRPTAAPAPPPSPAPGWRSRWRSARSRRTASSRPTPCCAAWRRSASA